ncbi:MAG: ATP-binding cassette domain-containing protein [Pseudomonadota bacterium]
MTKTLLTFEQVGLRLDGAWRMREMSLQVSAQGITGVMGPNGSGKSLFLRLAMGLLTPDEGGVQWNGVPAKDSRKDRGFVFQSTPLLRRSVFANVAYPLHIAGMRGSEVGDRVAHWLDKARLSHKTKDPAARLSGGEAQRMAIARALVRNPKVLLLDEPSASLDPSSTSALENLIEEVSEEGVKILMSTHDIGQAKRLSEDVVFLDLGRLAEQADAAQFFEAPSSKAAQTYLGGRL